MNIKEPTSKPSCVLGSLFVDGAGGGSAAFKRLLALGVQSGCFNDGSLLAIWNEAQKLEASRPGWVPFELVEVLEGLEDSSDVLKAVEVAKDDATNYSERVERFARDLVDDDLRCNLRLALRRAYDNCKGGEDFSSDVAEIVRLQERLAQPAVAATCAIVSDTDLCARNSPPPIPVIEGLADRGEVVLLVGSPKVGKSFAGMQMARAIATGQDFLRWHTRQGAVVYVNTEVGDVQWEHRSRDQNKAMGIDAVPLLYHWNVRGLNLTVSTLLPLLRAELDKAGITDVSAFFFDSFWTLSAGLDESKQQDVASFMLVVQALAKEYRANIYIVHHFKKDGRRKASAQDLLDRASGSGVFARAVDVFMALTEVNGKMRLDIRRRNAPSPVPLEVALSVPLWKVIGDAPSLDDTRQGRRVSYTPELVVGKWKSVDAVMKRCELEDAGIKHGSVTAALNRTMKAGLIEEFGDGYRLTADGKKILLGHGPVSTETP